MGKHTARHDRARRLALALVLSAAMGCGISLTGLGEASNDAGVDAARADADDQSDAEEARDAGDPDVETPDADAEPPPPGVGPTTRASVSLMVDQVRPQDGTIGTDGAFDGVFDVEITGPAVAVALLRTTADGEPTAFQEWDTWVGTDAIPGGVRAGYAYGLQTYQLGIFEGTVRLNDNGGRVTIPAGPHSLRIYGANVGSFAPGNYFRVLAEGADHTLLRGPVVAY